MKEKVESWATATAAAATNKQTTHQRKQHEKRKGRKSFSGEIFSLSAMQFATPPPKLTTPETTHPNSSALLANRKCISVSFVRWLRNFVKKCAKLLNFTI